MVLPIAIIPNHEGGAPLSAWFLVTYCFRENWAIRRGLGVHQCLNN